MPLQLGLCNTGAQRLLIDKWAGYWFVRVEDSQRATVVIETFRAFANFCCVRFIAMRRDFTALLNSLGSSLVILGRKTLSLTVTANGCYHRQ